MTIEARLHDLSKAFAATIIAQLRNMTIQELAGLGSAKAPKAAKASSAPTTTAAPTAKKRGKPGRLPRRSDADLQADMAKVIAFLKSHKGARAEHITAGLQMDRRALPKVIALALASKKITKKGHKRSTEYSAK